MQLASQHLHAAYRLLLPLVIILRAVLHASYLEI